MAENSEREKEIFGEALELGSLEEQRAFVKQACENDESLRQTVEGLLEAYTQAGSFIPPRVSDGLEMVRAAESSDDSGAIIGRYKLLEKIGEGGCGVVYVAEQQEPVRRRVALKVIKLGMDTRSVVARFEAERQALALMEHPNIAKVLDAGATEAGRPYFVMELVRGTKITDYCDEHQLTTAERLDLFAQVCRAVQHAHQKGIIHRDLKPSNILVTVNDGVAVPKVIDFGIAKATEGRLTDKTVYTELHQFLGTPAYMSPEQAELTSADIDTRSDIYSLGVLLYELLAGTTPFDHQELVKAGLDAMRQTIRVKDPPRPSTRLSTLGAAELSTVAQARRSEPFKLIHLVRGDLDWIVMKCLEKDRARRYETANGLARDIERHRNNEPVAARPPKVAYRFQKMVRRNKLAVAAGSAVTASLLAGLTLSTWLLLKEREAHLRQTEALRRADAAATEARMTLAASDFLEANRLIETEAAADALTYLSPNPPTVPRDAFISVGPLSVSAADAVAYLSRSLAADPDNEAVLTRLATLLTYSSWMMPTLSLKHRGPVYCAQFSPDGKRIVTASEDNTARVWDAQTGQPLAGPLRHADKVISAQFSSDGKRVVTASLDATARVWDAQTGQPLSGPLAHRGPVRYAQFSPDGTRVVTASDDHTARVWDAQSGQPLSWTLAHAGPVRTAQFSPDGTRIVTASEDNSARVWDAQTGQPLTQPLKHGGWVISAQFSPDGRRIVTASEDDSARVWDAQTGQALTAPLNHGFLMNSAQFSPDGTRIVTASRDQTARVWDAQTGQPVTGRLEHSGAVSFAQFSPDGRRVVTASRDNTVRVWDAQTGRPLTERLKQGGPVHHAQFSPDGKCVVTASDDGTALVWRAEIGQPLTEPLKHGDYLFSAQFSPDGSRVVTASRDNTARVWDAQTGQPITGPLIHGQGVNAAQFSADGRRVVTASDDSSARVWDSTTGQPQTEPLKHGGPVRYAQFSPDDRRIVTASDDNTAQVWDSTTGQPLTEPLKHAGSVRYAQFSPDGRRVVTASADNTARVWDSRTGQPVTQPLKHANWVNTAEFSADGLRIVTASADNSAQVWDAQTGRPLAQAMEHGREVQSARFSPDGKRVVTASYDSTARVWDAQTGQPVTEPLKHKNGVHSAQFSPDGKRVVTASWDNTARVWDAQTGQPLTQPFNHLRHVCSAQFSPDGKRIVTASDDNTARVWDIGFAPSRCPDWLLPLAEALSGNRLNKQGVVEPTRLDRAATIAQIRQQLAIQPDNGDGVIWGRWLLADRYSRTISPFSSIAVPEYIENRIRESTAESLEEAGRLASGNAEMEGQISEARGRLARAEELDLLRSRGISYARRGHWTNAIADFSKLIELEPANHFYYHSLAPLLVQSGDLEGYRRHCARILARFGGTSDPVIADRMAKDCLILPSAGTNLVAIGQLAETAVLLGSSNKFLAYFQGTKGLAEYRQGHFAEAVRWTRKAIDNKSFPDGTRYLEAYMVLAMAQYQLNQNEEARAALAKGLEIEQLDLPRLESKDLGSEWLDWIFAQALMKEARALIEGQTTASDVPSEQKPPKAPGP